MRRPEWGSDTFAAALDKLDLKYIALNPGASFRGLHDSLVNFTSECRMLLCIHEETAVSIAQGWAKVTGRAMGVALHSNVGLLHASMSIFNAWCDRMPMLIIGAMGPVDAMKRRPWIDWVHTSQDQGALIRDFVKWDDQPGSVGAACQALAEGAARAQTAPCGPVYVNLDSALQEQELATPVAQPDFARLKPAPASKPDPALVRDAAAMLSAAKAPVILMGRLSHSDATWERRVALAEHLGARVITDFKAAASFPTAHPAIAGTAGYFPDPIAREAIGNADVVLNLGWIDFAGTMRAVYGDRPVPAGLISASNDAAMQRGWVRDSGALAPADIAFQCAPDDLVEALTGEMKVAAAAFKGGILPIPAVEEGPLSPQDIAALLREALQGRKTCLMRGPLSWTGADWPVEGPLDALGADGGGGIGSGPGMAVGAALALRDHHPDRFPLAVLGDGDFLMNASALWTAANQKIPMLIVVVNNHSFYNDEVHQETVARVRGRPVENKTVGIELIGPDIGIAGIAQGFGAECQGRLTAATEVRAALQKAIATVDLGGVALVEIEATKGYAPSMVKVLQSES
ncbi:thiamine pyrophosphate-binding protein [Chelativorans salis]|uniref:Thiamine pyrophosphate-binding protein n=1 Tax=Chelativorans salis TaxID=2978478 RepID=A0ABT2LGX2_9HYPH|nr:thiamine pyrophosphate-dependent enzyme [Chelativorans sp. EGI FJ00035]MCT7373780.1 thiamine pyrophosphate-binding protein [Chelativorans sp. EGI FJ00035]